MSDLRKKLIKLAYENPAIRSHLLPLLKKTARIHPNEWREFPYAKYSGPVKVREEDEVSYYEFTLKVPVDVWLQDWRTIHVALTPLAHFFHSHFPAEIGHPGQAYREAMMFTDPKQVGRFVVIHCSIKEGYDI